MFVAALSAVPHVGCSDNSGNKSKNAVDPGAPTPLETIARLTELRKEGRYDAMRPYIVPERAGDVVVTLVAVQDFLNANEQLCALVRQKIGPGLAATIDQGHHAYRLGIFSRSVELLDGVIDGNSAVVTFTVDGQLPARTAELRVVGGQWCYDPGPGDATRLAKAFTMMADGLRKVAGELKSDRVDIEKMRTDPESLAKLVAAHLKAGVQMIPPPPIGSNDEQPQTPTASNPAP